jgi:hypothetical protein
MWNGNKHALTTDDELMLMIDGVASLRRGCGQSIKACSISDLLVGEYIKRPFKQLHM